MLSLPFFPSSSLLFIHLSTYLSINHNRTHATNLRVRLGDYNLKGQTELYPHEEFTVRRKVVNENYNPATYQNDIALLELSEEVVYRHHIVPVCLPAKGENFTGKTATVTGWGRTQVRTIIPFDL